MNLSKWRPLAGFFFILFWLMCFFFLNLDGNWYDVLPFARADLFPHWIPGDWYLTRDIQYRFFFHLLAAPAYEYLGLVPTYILGKLLVYSYFAYLLLKTFRYFSLPLWTLAIFLPIFCRIHSFAADEWMINEFDTKSFAYLFCLHSWLLFLERRFLAFAFFLGFATSFHILVGGYFFVSILLPSMILHLRQLPRSAKIYCQAFCLFALAALNALIFAFHWLQARVNAEIAQLATEISLWKRLSNHLLPSEWNWARMGWQLLALALGFLIWQLGQKRYWGRADESEPSGRGVGAGLARRELFWCTLGSLALFSLGLFFWQIEAWSLLALYPFRVPDSFLPFILGLVWAGAIANLLESPRAWLASRVRQVLILCSLALALYSAQESWQRFAKRYAEIPFDLYAWIQTNTKASDRFLTSPDEKYFYALAERSAVKTFKHFPQLAEDIVEWDRYFSELGCPLEKVGPTANRKLVKKCYENLAVTELLAKAQGFAATYVITEAKSTAPAPLFTSRTGESVYLVPRP